MGALGSLVGPLVRYDETKCLLISFNVDLGLILGLILGPLGSFLGTFWGFLVPLGSFLRLLGELLGASWDPLTHLTSNAFTISGVQKSAYFPSGSSMFSTWWPLGGFLGPLECLLGALVGILRHLGGVLAPSWEACWLLGGPAGENVDFSLVL